MVLNAPDDTTFPDSLDEAQQPGRRAIQFDVGSTVPGRLTRRSFLARSDLQ
jgi:hypothetical protein